MGGGSTGGLVVWLIADPRKEEDGEEMDRVGWESRYGGWEMRRELNIPDAFSRAYSSYYYPHM